MNPEDLKYTAEHEWVRARRAECTVRVGITDYAQDALGDIVYVNLPAVGDTRSPAAARAASSSRPRASVTSSRRSTARWSRVNDALNATPSCSTPTRTASGWLVEITAGDAAAVDGLLTPRRTRRHHGE